MSKVLDEIKQGTSQLSDEERAKLALFLIQSLESSDGGDTGDVKEAWRLEAEARLAQIEKGDARLVSGEEVFANVRRQLN